jgi:hypothetical protein
VHAHKIKTERCLEQNAYNTGPLLYHISAVCHLTLVFRLECVQSIGLRDYDERAERK